MNGETDEFIEIVQNFVSKNTGLFDTKYVGELKA